MRAKHVDDSYRAFVRTKPCARCDAPAPSDAHHLVSVGWREPWRNDYVAIPLCRHCHSLWEHPGMTIARWLALRQLPSIFLAETVAALLVEYFTRRPELEAKWPF